MMAVRERRPTLCNHRFFVVHKGGSYGNKLLYKNLKFFDKAVEDFVTLFMGKKSC